MRTIAALALGLGMLGSVGLAVAQEKDKKGEAPKLEGSYTLVAGKKNGAAVDDDAKKGKFTFTADKVTIEGMGLKFVMSYKVDPKTDPMGIDMEIVDGPDGAKGLKAAGIVELKGDTLKLAYLIPKEKEEKPKRPANFDGKDGFMFEFKKKDK